MGIAVSNWRLARAVAERGQLGVVSATSIDAVLARRLQDGDAGGHMRRSIARFPIPSIAETVLRRYFREGGRPPGTPYKAIPMHRLNESVERDRLTVLAAFVEVDLAREGHDGVVGVNLLTKIQLPTLPALYGAMLAGVDYVLMGAGIPREIPGALDAMANHDTARLRLDLLDAAAGDVEYVVFDPRSHWDRAPVEVRRPLFLPIISSHSLATVLARKATGRVDGFVVEGPTAGGHNAPPRGELVLDAGGEPVYGERDVADLAKIGDLGLPFWVAGGAGHPDRLVEALAAGAAGIQVGTLFAYCRESGLADGLKQSVLEHAARGEVRVHTDVLASPTGFPFKVVHWPGDPGLGQHRKRVCDLGYLRVAYRAANGRIDYRCASEPVDTFVMKGGKVEETEGRRCLCNALLANIGMAQEREDGTSEPPILTSGDDLESIAKFLQGRAEYGAADVLDYLLSGVVPPAPTPSGGRTGTASPPAPTSPSAPASLRS
jgi:NAD(P)H-dependent flavin oxidoreductase YrpB (nitropropane dioxygenase family)